MKRVTLGFVMTLVAAVFIAGPAFARDDYPPAPTEAPEVVVSPTEVVAPVVSERPARGAERVEAEQLAVTGFDVTAGMLAGAGLLGAGGVALVSARRKSRSSSN
jgi:hypothetical protein